MTLDLFGIGEDSKDGSHKEAFRFSKDFSILGLAYDCLYQSPIFIFANPKHLTKVSDFWIAHRDFYNHKQVWIFIRIFVCY